jgi:predicted ATPase
MDQMAKQAVKFARLLTEAIYRIRARESKPIRTVEDELGYALGKKGGASIEYWRKGHLPAKLSDLEAVAREICRRTDLGPAWLEAFLRSADHPQPPALVREMCGPATAVLPPTPVAAPLPTGGNLPISTTPFIGRSRELALIGEHLEDNACRLLTLVGMGGIGKTRLALEAAQLKQDRFPDGAYFASLVALSSGDLLLSTLANAINLSFYSGSPARVQLLSYLRRRHMLLIIDNFEHLMPEVGLLVEILEQAPGVKLLVTSRERLNLRGEWVFEVEGMPVPSGSALPPGAGGLLPNGDAPTAENVGPYTAIHLFVQSARRVRTDFSLNSHDLAYVIRICRLVKGIPLGIELAAAWVKMLSCEEIAREIEQNYSFLATAWHDVPERHRSLQAVFDYSWNLLSESERTAMGKLALFRGGFTREAAAEVAGASLLTLAVLVDKSILRLESPARGAAGQVEWRVRYDMHDLLRHYGEEKLVEKEETNDLHCRYYADFLQSQGAPLRSGRQKETLEEIGREIENVRAAWRWAVARGRLAELACSLDTLYNFYDIRGWIQEGEEAFAAAVAWLRAVIPLRQATAADNLTLGRLLARLGRFKHRLGLYDQARELLEESLALFHRLEAPQEIVFALNYLGNIAYRLGDYETARQICQESLVICRDFDYRWELVTAVETLAHVAEELGEYHEARGLCRQGLEICQSIGDRRGVAAFLNGSGYLQWRLGDPTAARRLCQESLAIYREIGDRRGTALATKNLGNVAAYVEDFALAQQYYLDSLTICREIGYQWGIAVTLNNLGTVAWLLQEYESARSYCSQSLEIWRRLGDQWGCAGSLETLGNVSLAVADWSGAKDHFGQALHIAMEIKAVPLALQIMIGMADLLAHQGHQQCALEILVFAGRHPLMDQEGRQRAEEVYAELALHATPEQIAQAQQQGALWQLEAVAAELLSMKMKDATSVAFTCLGGVASQQDS